MKVVHKNERIKEALGIRSVLFCFYRENRSHWDVVMEDGTSLRVSLPNLATESSVLKQAAERLGRMGRAVKWPKGGAQC